MLCMYDVLVTRFPHTLSIMSKSSVDDDLQTNPFFTAFSSSNYFATCAPRHLLVCVPVTESLKLSKITRDFIETHILEPVIHDTTIEWDPGQPRNKNIIEYKTMNGKTVMLKDSKLSCTSGFPHPRTVAILEEELYYDDEYQSFGILRVNFPLCGKVPMAYFKQVTTQASLPSTSIEHRSISEHARLIERITGESITSPNNAVSTAIQRFATTFNTSYVMVKGFIEHTGKRVREACYKIRDDAVVKSKLPKSTLTRSLIGQFQTAIEIHVMLAIHKKIFTGLTELYVKEEAHLQACISSARHLSMTELGIRPDIVCDPELALIRLRQLNTCVTPIDKLACLQDVNRLMADAVNNSTTSPSSSSSSISSPRRDTILSADDVLPLTVYLIIHSQLTPIHANLQYMLHFTPDKNDINIDHLSVHVTMMQAAVQFIESGRLGTSSPQSDAASPIPSHVNGVTQSLADLDLDPLSSRATLPRSTTMPSTSTSTSIITTRPIRSRSRSNSRSTNPFDETPTIRSTNPFDDGPRNPFDDDTPASAPVATRRVESRTSRPTSRKPSQDMNFSIASTSISSSRASSRESSPFSSRQSSISGPLSVQKIPTPTFTSTSTSTRSSHSLFDLPEQKSSPMVRNNNRTVPPAMFRLDEDKPHEDSTDDTSGLGSFLSRLRDQDDIVTGRLPR